MPAASAIDLSGGTRRRAAAAPGIRGVAVLCVALALLPVAQLGRLPVIQSGSKDAPILFNDLLIAAIWAAGAALVLTRREWKLDRPALFALAFAGVGGFSALLAMPRFGLTLQETLFSLAYLARWLAYFGVYLFAINVVTRADVPRVYGVLEAAVLAFAAFGVVQAAFLPDFAFVVYPDAVPYVDWDIQGHRLVSTFLDPNFAGMLVVLLLLPQLARLSYGLPVASWKVGLLGLALILTLSRGALLGFVAGGVTLLAIRGPNRFLLRLAGWASLLLLPALPFLLRYAATFNKLDLFEPSAMSRVAQWVWAIQLIGEYPVVGVGFNTYGFVQRAYGARSGLPAAFGLDGGLLFILTLTGVVGLSLYLGMTLGVVRRCRRVWRDATAAPEDRALCVGVAASTTALLVQSLFLNSILYPFVMETVWVLWALTFVVARPAEPSEAVGPGTRTTGPVLVGFRGGGGGT